MMNICVRWQDPVELIDGSNDGYIYWCDLESIPDSPGIYVFARQFGDSVTPLYVGQAMNMRLRVKQQFNNLKLMRAIENAQIGRRILLLGEILTKPGQKIERVLDVIEGGMIEYIVTNEYELINKMGTKLAYDAVTFEGNLLSRRLCPRTLHVPW
jgi:hypothetical protein